MTDVEVTDAEIAPDDGAGGIESGAAFPECDRLGMTAAVVEQVPEVVRCSASSGLGAHRGFENGDLLEARGEAVIGRKRGGALEVLPRRWSRRRAADGASPGCNAPGVRRPSFGRADRRGVPRRRIQQGDRLGDTSRRGRKSWARSSAVCRSPLGRLPASRRAHPSSGSRASVSRRIDAASVLSLVRSAAVRAEAGLVSASFRRAMTFRLRARRLSVLNRSERSR